MINMINNFEISTIKMVKGIYFILVLVKKNAVNSFKKDFFKLMSNSFYGKTVENLRERVNVSWLQKRNLVAIHEIQTVLTLDKPIF